MSKKILGIAWKIATGKTHLLNHFKEFATAHAIKIFTINGDEIRRNMFSYSTDNKHIALRRQLIQDLHLQHFQKNYALDGAQLQKEVFHDKEKYTRYQEIIKKELWREIKELCLKTSETIVIERALLLENEFLGISFDHIYYTTCEDAEIFSRLQGGDLPQPAIAERVKNFYSLDQAHSILQHQYAGKYTLLDTTIIPTKENYKNLFNTTFLSNAT